jgi:MFS family permease
MERSYRDRRRRYTVAVSDRLFTPRFLTMFSTARPSSSRSSSCCRRRRYRVLELGGSTAAAGLFLGLLTYSSAFSAPLTGSIADSVGQRRTLIVVSLVVAACSASYAFISRYEIMLVIVVIHGLFWSGLLSASGAYMTATIPVSRRAEGLSYWGLASVTAIAAAPRWASGSRATAGRCSASSSSLNLTMALMLAPARRSRRRRGCIGPDTRRQHGELGSIRSTPRTD